MVEGSPVDQAPLRRLLADPELDARVRDIGYCTLPLASQAVVERLRRDYGVTHPGSGAGFDIDFAYLNPELKQAVVDVTTPLWTEFAAAHAVDVRPFLCTYVAKWPGPASSLSLHQDWTYVDEDAHRALIVWLALDDVSRERGNGPMRLIPGSHRWPGGLRGANTIDWYVPYRPSLEPHTQTISLRAGDAIVMDSRLVHGSAANQSGSMRLAVSARFAPVEATLRYAHLAADGWTDVYQVDPSFFVERGAMDLALRPPCDRPLLGRSPPGRPSITAEDLAALLGTEEVPAEVPDGHDVGFRFGREPLPSAEVFAAADPGGEAGWLAHVPDLAAASRATTALLAGREAGTDRVRIDVNAAPGAAELLDAVGLWPADVEDGWMISVGSGQMHVGATSAGRVRMLVIEATPRVGTCFIQVGSHQRPLTPGDALEFDARVEHSVWNNSGEPCTVLAWIGPGAERTRPPVEPARPVGEQSSPLRRFARAVLRVHR